MSRFATDRRASLAFASLLRSIVERCIGEHSDRAFAVRGGLFDFAPLRAQIRAEVFRGVPLTLDRGEVDLILDGIFACVSVDTTIGRQSLAALSK